MTVDPNSVSPYLLRPLRSYEEVLRTRERDHALYAQREGQTEAQVDGAGEQAPTETVRASGTSNRETPNTQQGRRARRKRA